MQPTDMMMAAVAAAVITAVLLALLLLRRLRGSSSSSGAIRVTDIFIYPVKSCGGLSLSSSSFTRRGFRYDRSWMIVNADTGNMLTAREVPHLVRIRPEIDEREQTITLRCDLPGLELGPLVMPLHPAAAAAAAASASAAASAPASISVQVWDERFPALHCGAVAAAWVTAVAAWTPTPNGRSAAIAASRRKVPSYALVAVPEQHDRPLKAKYDWTTVPSASASASASAFADGDADAAVASGPKETHSSAGGFADAFPFLLASRASLRELNGWTAANGRTLEMEAFRPNIVVDGPEGALKAWEEDWWRTIRTTPADAIAVASADSASASASGSASASPDAASASASPSSCEFSIAKPCTRCIMTTVIPSTGLRHPSGEPLVSLRAHRMILPERPGKEAEVYFAQNVANLTRTGTVRVGDLVQVIQRKPTRYEEIPKSGSEGKKEQ